MTIVRERHVGSNEHIVFDAQAVPHLNPALDRHAIADNGLALDEAMRANVAVCTDLGAGKNHHELPNAGSVAGGRLAVGQGVNLRRH